MSNNDLNLHREYCNTEGPIGHRLPNSYAFVFEFPRNFACICILAIYAPMIYTALCVMFLMRADPLRGQVGGGWALEIESFLGPVKCHRAVRRVPFGAQKTRVS
jgi:hypothetical protein